MKLQYQLSSAKTDCSLFPNLHKHDSQALEIMTTDLGCLRQWKTSALVDTLEQGVRKKKKNERQEKDVPHTDASKTDEATLVL